MKRVKLDIENNDMQKKEEENMMMMMTIKEMISS